MKKTVCMAVTLAILLAFPSCAGETYAAPDKIPVKPEQTHAAPILRTSLPKAAAIQPNPSEYEMPAADITRLCGCTASSNASKLERAFDGKEGTYWDAKRGQEQYIELTLPQDIYPGSIHICWKDVPPAWKLEAYDQDNTTLQTCEGNGWLHAHVELTPGTRRITITADNTTGLFRLREISVFSRGTLPGGVQAWEEAGKTDLMVVACHPDDEYLYMGGTIPYFAGEMGKETIVVYMTYGKAERKTEALNGLWAAGVKNYPVFGELHDKLVKSLKAARDLWGEDETVGFLVEQIRKYKPDVMVSHDLKGEYGHGQHKLTADAVLQAIQYAGDATIFPDSAARFGTWQVKKCYLHLYREDPVKMDWRIPLKRFGGKTALDMAKKGFSCHKSQHKYGFQVLDSGKYDCSLFGLAYTGVGPDSGKNDFFENIP